jgi:DNA-binding transcriptional LysR family regulator
VEFDLGQVRAFVAAAEELYFGRAADRLLLSPQALSKRVRRLEETLCVPLFARGVRPLALTEAGTAFLPRARSLLASAGEAPTRLRPVHVDAWGGERFLWPVVTGLGARLELQVELSGRRSLPRALTALRRGEIDAALGRVHDLGHPWPTGLSSRPIRFQPYRAALADGHPLAGAAVLRPADLRPYGLRAAAESPETAGFVRRFGRCFELPVTPGGPGLIEAGAEPPPGVTVVPLAPTPLYAWSLVWRAGDRHSALHRLIRALTKMSQDRRWLAVDPDAHWVPGIDLTMPGAG